MATITIPNPATQQEIRCNALICRNALDVSEADPLTKYSVEIDRMAEPQDATGKRVGERVRLESRRVPMADIFGASVTIDGLTLSGAQILAFVNGMVDQFKASDLEAQP